MTPGSGIRNRFFPDPGSRIPDPKPIFLITFWVTNSLVLGKFTQIFFFRLPKIK
jgi:hypothetical protein